MDIARRDVLFEVLKRSDFSGAIYGKLCNDGVICNADLVIRQRKDLNGLGRKSMDVLGQYMARFDLNFREPECTLAARIKSLFPIIRLAPVSFITSVDNNVAAWSIHKLIDAGVYTISDLQQLTAQDIADCFNHPINSAATEGVLRALKELLQLVRR